MGGTTRGNPCDDQNKEIGDGSDLATGGPYERQSQLAYIASKNPIAAIAVGLRLRNAIEKLTVFPNAGRPGRRSGTRELFVTGTSMIVIYAVNEGLGEVQILGIVHAKQKYPPE